MRLWPGLSIRRLKACRGVALVGAAWSMSVRPMAADVPGEYDVKAAFVIADKAINSHPLTITRPAAASEFKGVNVLFVSGSERSRASEILKRLQAASFLTVSDIDDFCAMSGMIHLTNQQQRIRFEVSLTAAQRAGLTISSKLLVLARTVYTEKGPQ